MTETVVRVLEELRHEWFLGFSHQLDYTLLDRVLVLVQPTLDIIRHLRNIKRSWCSNASQIIIITRQLI